MQFIIVMCLFARSTIILLGHKVGGDLRMMMMMMMLTEFIVVLANECGLVGLHATE